MMLPLANGEWFELPPVHPILVNFTAALVPVSLVCDLLGTWLKKESLRSAGWWTLLFAAVVTPFTALAGWLWLRDMGWQADPEMEIHEWLGTAFAVVLIPLAVWRGVRFRRGAGPGTAYLVVLAVALLVVVVQGHLGGIMSFGSGQEGQGHEHSGAPALHVEALAAAPAPATTTQRGGNKEIGGPL